MPLPAAFWDERETSPTRDEVLERLREAGPQKYRQLKEHFGEQSGNRLKALLATMGDRAVQADRPGEAYWMIPAAARVPHEFG
jgi:hypothetical protein